MVLDVEQGKFITKHDCRSRYSTLLLDQDEHVKYAVLDKMSRFTYQILDPFDRTYNPSKAALEGSEVDKLFRKALDFSFIDLLTD